MRSWILPAAALTACVESGPVTVDETWDTPVVWDTGTADTPVLLSGFSWVVDDALGGMPLPGSRASLDNDLTWLSDQGLDLLISLTETALDPDEVRAHGMDPLHIPVEDFTAPEQDQIDALVDEVAIRLGHGDRVGIHCHGGLGRTGTMLATWFVADGRTAEDAMAHVRDLRPGSIETEEQEDAVRRFEERVRPVTP